MSLNLREEIKNFPPPEGEDALLGHDGRLNAEEVKYLQDLGYTVAHYKSFSGAKFVQSYFEGIAKGLIELDPQVFKSVDTIRKQFSKTETGESDLKAKSKVEKVDAIKLLSNLPTLVPEEGKKRGRPPKKLPDE